MSLNLENALKGESDHLDGTWLVVVSKTCHQSSTLMKDLDLRDVGSSFVSFDLLALLDHLDRLVLTCGEKNLSGLRLVDDASKLEVLNVKLGHHSRLVAFILFIWIGVESVSKDVTIPTSRDET